MASDRQHLVVSLGYSMARVEAAKANGLGKPNPSVRLYIVTPSCTEEHSHAPAESVEIFGLENLMTLRDLLNQAIKLAHDGASSEPLVQAVINKNAGV